MAGHTETSLLDAEVYDQDEIVKAKGFDDGTKWAKTLRELVRKGKVEPSLEKLLGLEGGQGPDSGEYRPLLLVCVLSSKYTRAIELVREYDPSRPIRWGHACSS